MIGPKDFLAMVITAWEGGYQSYADDMGNWITLPDGSRRKIGTMRGVTPAALAKHRGIDVSTLTEVDMQSVTLDEAVDIGYQHYYVEPKFNLFRWGGAAAAVTDFGWGSGPYQAALSTQRLIGVGADGIVGPVTRDAFDAWLQRIGEKASIQAIQDMRESFYHYICQIRPSNEQYLQGWLNRDRWVSNIDPDKDGMWG